MGAPASTCLDLGWERKELCEPPGELNVSFDADRVERRTAVDHRRDLGRRAPEDDVAILDVAALNIQPSVADRSNVACLAETEADARIEAQGGSFFMDLPALKDTLYYEEKFRDPEGVIFDISEKGWLTQPT